MNSEIRKLDSNDISKGQRGRKVLLVEDEPHWQAILGGIVRSADPTLKIRCARTANQAEQILFADPDYDLIISDHFLQGGESGLSLWTRCRQTSQHIPFMMVSGMTEDEFSELLDGYDNYPLFVPKEKALDDLREAVKWHIQPKVREMTNYKKALPLMAIGLFLIATLFTSFQTPHVTVAMKATQAPVALKPPAALPQTITKVERKPAIASVKKYRFEDIFTPHVQRQIQEVLKASEKNLAIVKGMQVDVD